MSEGRVVNERTKVITLVNYFGETPLVAQAGDLVCVNPSPYLSIAFCRPEDAVKLGHALAEAAELLASRYGAAS